MGIASCAKQRQQSATAYHKSDIYFPHTRGFSTSETNNSYKVHVRCCVLLPTTSPMAQIALESLLEKLMSKVLALHACMHNLDKGNTWSQNSDDSNSDSEYRHEGIRRCLPDKSRACTQGLQGC